MREGFPNLRSEIRSEADATAVFSGKDSEELASAVASLARRNILREGVTLEAAQAAARAGGAAALWKAIGSYNQLAINNALLRRQRLPELTREAYETETRALGEEPSDREYESILQRKRISALQHGNAKRKAESGGSPPTIERQLSELSEAADTTRRSVNQLVAELDYFSRTNLLNGPILKASQTAAEEQIFKNEIHTTITRCRAALVELGNLERLAERLSKDKSKGGAPSHVFHRTFVTAMLPVWEELTGSPAKRDNKHVIDLLSAAYFCLTDEEYKDWKGPLRQEVKDRDKGLVQN